MRFTHHAKLRNERRIIFIRGLIWSVGNKYVQKIGRAVRLKLSVLSFFFFFWEHSDMNWLAKTLLLVLVCSGLAAVACGESIYMNRGPSLDMAYNVLEARDASTAAVGTSYTPASGYKRAGIGLSPDETILYTAAYSATNNNTELWSYNAATGAYIGSVTVSSGILCRGLAVDPDTGNVYVSLTGSIAQITPSGDVNTSWGTGLTVADLEIYDGKLYGGGYQTGTKGVYWWDLNAGGSGGGAASVLNGTIDTAVYGLAFAPDGTLFTGINAGENLSEAMGFQL